MKKNINHNTITRKLGNSTHLNGKKEKRISVDRHKSKSVKQKLKTHFRRENRQKYAPDYYGRRFFFFFCFFRTRNMLFLQRQQLPLIRKHVNPTGFEEGMIYIGRPYFGVRNLTPLNGVLSVIPVVALGSVSRRVRRSRNLTFPLFDRRKRDVLKTRRFISYVNADGSSQIL